MEVVINISHGGFGISEKAFKKLINLGMKLTKYDEDGYRIDKNADISENTKLVEIIGKYSFTKSWDKSIRTDRRLIQVIKELGGEANGQFAELKIIDIPDDIKWEIEEHNGLEWIAEKHRVWG